MASELKPCPFCRKPMMLREALWPSEGDTDAIIHADKTDCPMFGFGDGSADGSIVEKWNICSSDDEDDFPSDGSCIRCGSVPRNANGLCNTCLDEDAERLENTRPAPAATDTGLVTKGYLFQTLTEKSGWLTKFSFTDPTQGGLPYRAVEKLCLQSQAEELLAAERAESDEAYELGKRDGYSEAVQEIDLKTGGDGEYRYCTDHDPDRHTPDPASMIQRIVERFETLNTMESVSEINEWKKCAEKAEADNAAKDKRLKEANHV